MADQAPADGDRNMITDLLQNVLGGSGGAPAATGTAAPTTTDDADHHEVIGGLVGHGINILSSHVVEQFVQGSYGTPPLEESNVHEIGPQDFQNGKKKALLIGINYINASKGQLKGCINDAANVEKFLIQCAGYKKEGILKLTDDNPEKLPTKQNIINSCKWLVDGAKPGDCLFFHFSGHGGQVKDTTHLEHDGMAETIIPCDFETNGQIVDDDLHDMLVENLPAGCHFTAIFDSCHSSSVLDLPYVFKSKSATYDDAHKAENDSIFHRHSSGWGLAMATGLGGLGHAILKAASTEVIYQGKRAARQKISERLHATEADVYMFAGCRDDQTSADTSAFGEPTGALSYAFISVLSKNPTQTYATLIDAMRDLLHQGSKKFTQMPQLSMGKLSEGNTPFFC